MADVDIGNPAFEPDDWEEDTGDDGNLSTSLHDPGVNDDGMSSKGATIQTSVTSSLQQELLQTAVDDYYNAVAEVGLTPSLGRDRGKFKLVDGQIRLKAYPNLDLVNKKSGRPLALSTLASRGGTKAIREDLGFVDWAAKKSSLPAAAVAALSRANQELGEVAGPIDTVELQDLGQTANEALDAIHTMETALTDADIDEILETINDPPLNLREIRGLDKALQTIRGELTNNLAKLSVLDEHIATEKRKLDEADSGGDIDESIRRRIAERLRELQDERASRLEAASANREALRSQINRMRETINRILHEDTNLAERIRTLFREQGVTIASILTAIGMAISTLVLALTGGGAATPSPIPPPPPDKGGIKEWVKKHLQSLGLALAKLAGKAAAALPGIIGSIVSWLLTLLAKTAGWLAENLWAIVVAVGGLLLVVAREWLSK